MVLMVSLGLLALFFYVLSNPPATVVATSSTPFPTVSAQDPLPISAVVADVNGQIIAAGDVQTMARIDQAMSALLGAPVGQDLLERSVNGELAWQAAQQAGRQPAPASEQELQAWLASSGRTPAELLAVLQQNGVTYETFLAYFNRLQFISRFSVEQAARLGLSDSDYVRGLQRQARISFGPAAHTYFGSAAGAVPQPQPFAQAALPVTTAPVATGPVVTGAEVTAGAQAAPVTAASTPEAAEVTGIGPQVGLLAPDFDLPGLNIDQKQSLGLADLAGKALVLNFFATWCPYCRSQTPLLVEAAQKYAGAPVQFAGVDVGETREQVLAYIEQMQIPYPVLLDNASQTAGAYAVSGFPTTLFIDAHGKVVNVQVGLMSPEDLDRFIQLLIIESGN